MENNKGAPLSGSVAPSSEYINITKTIKFSYKWVISDISNVGNLQSPIFSNEMDNRILWRLDIQNVIEYPHFQRWDVPYIEHMCVKLIQVSTADVTEIHSNCKFQLLSIIPENTRTWNKAFKLSSDKNLDCFNITRCEILDPEERFLQNGNITLTCEIIAVVSISMPPHTIPNFTWRDDLDNIFENRKFTDVALCASGKEYHVHKVILAARSSVFNAMFEHEMVEKKQGRVEITDIDGEALGELLRFIYTGKVLNIKNFAFDLVHAAEKYQLKNLKMLCENELCSNISVENAAEVLVLADTYNLDQLKAVAASFIGSHVVEIARTSGWQSMLKSHVGLFTEVFCDLVQERNFLLSLD